MDAIAEIRDQLSDRQTARSTVGDDFIMVAPRDEPGFNVRLEVGDGEFVVSFDGWHAHIPDYEVARELFFRGLGKECRLKVTCYGNFPQKWTLEHMRDGEWIDHSTTGLIFFPFWRRKRVTYKSNQP